MSRVIPPTQNFSQVTLTAEIIGHFRNASTLREVREREITDTEDSHNMIELAEKYLAVGRESEAHLRFDGFGMHDRCQELFDLLKEFYVRNFDKLDGESLLLKNIS